MEYGIKLLVGVILLVFSVAYLYRPSVVLRVNAWGRLLFFNDSYLLHYRRRWGLLAFLGAILFLYSGFMNMERNAAGVPVDNSLEEGYLSFYSQRFDIAAEVARRYLANHPQDPHAEFLFRQASAAARRAKQTP
jgi:hypothetical protein